MNQSRNSILVEKIRNRKGFCWMLLVGQSSRDIYQPDQSFVRLTERITMNTSGEGRHTIDLPLLHRALLQSWPITDVCPPVHREQPHCAVNDFEAFAQHTIPIRNLVLWPAKVTPNTLSVTVVTMVRRSPSRRGTFVSPNTLQDRCLQRGRQLCRCAQRVHPSLLLCLLYVPSDHIAVLCNRSRGWRNYSHATPICSSA